MAIFNSYVSLPEGIPIYPHSPHPECIDASSEIQGAYASGTFAKGEAAGDVDATEISGVSVGTSSGTCDNNTTRHRVLIVLLLWQIMW
jgi:hypothetical protein